LFDEQNGDAKDKTVEGWFHRFIINGGMTIVKQGICRVIQSKVKYNTKYRTPGDKHDSHAGIYSIKITTA
jgi:hypothetical protein